MVRLFRLYGIDTKTSIDLNDFVVTTDPNKRSWYLLTLPQGLGFGFTNTYIKVGSSRLRVSQEQKYDNITGTIEVCGKTRHDWEINYNKLRDFIAKNKQSGFKLYYKNIETQERYILCDVQLFSKTEKSSYCIPVGVEFQPKSLWLDDEELSYRVNIDTPRANMYAFLKDDNFSDDWHYNYGYSKDNNFSDVVGSYIDENGVTHEIIDEWNYNIYYMSALSGFINISNYSDAEIPLKFTIYGACTNPEIRIKDANDNIVQKCKIYASLNNGDRLIINSDPKDLYILLVRNDGTEPEIKTFSTDLGEGYNSFLTLPVGEYSLEIDDGSSYITADIKYSLEYLGG